MTTIDRTGASDAEFEARIAPFDAAATAPDERVETVARAIADSDYETVERGWVELDGSEREIYRRLAAAAIAALPPSPAEEAVKRVEALADELERRGHERMARSREPDTLVAKQLRSGALARLADADMIRAALASPAPAPHGEEGQR